MDTNRAAPDLSPTPRDRRRWKARRARPAPLAERLEVRQLLAGSPFATAPQYLVGRFPQGVVAADFTGDGTVDLATVNYDAGSVSVLPGLGDGSFGTAVDSPAGGSPYLAATADVNSDGKADLVASNTLATGTVSVLLGNGDGTFQAPRSFAAGRFPTDVAIADVNEDGRPDVVVVSSVDNAINVLLGNGDGTFQPLVSQLVAGGPSNVAVGDFNHDNHIDLAASVGGSVVVLAGRGDGTFGVPLSSPLGGAAEAGAVVAADFNKDGNLDLATAGGVAGTGNLYVLTGNGDGTFAPAVGVAPLGPSVDFYELVSADLDGDGNADLAATSYNFGPGDVSVVLGRGDGSFAPAAHYTAGRNPTGVVAADLNNDGRLDLASANGTEFQSRGSVSVLLNRGQGQFVGTQDVFTGDVPAGVTIADVNGDGTPDLLAANSFSNELSVALGRGDGTFLPSTLFQTGFRPGAVAAGDFNGDGNVDIVTLNQNDLSLLTGHGDGTFGAPTALTAGTAPSSLVVGDFNRDGRLDLAVSDNGSNVVAGGLVVLLGNGDGSFTLGAPPTLPTKPAALAGTDLNGDGNLDLVTFDTQEAQLFVLLGRGDGTFAFLTTLNAGTSTGAIALGDVNADGKPDIVAASTSESAVGIYLGNGNGTFGARVTYSTTSTDPVIGTVGTFPQGVAIGDFNGDGKVDVLTADAGSGQSDDGVSYLQGNGDGTFQPAVAVGVGSGPDAITAADLNGDGATDAVTANIAGNTLTVLLGIQAAAPTISVADVTVAEGNAGENTAVFTITLSAPSASPVQVAYATQDMTATAPGDYTSTSGLLVFNPGQTTRTIAVPIVGNTTVGPDKTFRIVLSSPAGATIARGIATATITEDDVAGTLQFGSATYSVGEGGGSIAITVSRTGGAASGVSAQVIVSGGSATPGVDFTPASFGTVTFGAGQTTQTLVIDVLDDAIVEGNETIVLTLSTPGSGATLGSPASTTLTIVDNDSSNPTADRDGDGVPDTVEAAGPGDGDANGDGVPDATQSNVASLPNAVDGRYVTLVAPEGTSLVNVRAVANPSPQDVPPGLIFPIGFFAFGVTGISPGGSADVTLILPAGVSVDTYEKFGPSPANPADHWYDFASDGTTGATLAPGRVVLRFVDGARGDSDLAADGRISDPGGPAVRAATTDAVPPTLTRVERFGIHMQPTSLVLTFSEALDPVAAESLTNYVITAPGRDGRFGTADDRRIAIRRASYNAATWTVTLDPAERLDLHKSYRLVVNGSAGGLTDLAGNALDGDRDGIAGGSAVVSVNRGLAVMPAGPTPGGPLSLPARPTHGRKAAPPVLGRPSPMGLPRAVANRPQAGSSGDSTREQRAAARYLAFVERNMIIRVK